MPVEGHEKRPLLLFLFDAFDPERGTTVKGSWWAQSEEQAKFWLESQGYTAIQLRLSPKLLGELRVRRTSLVLFYRQLAVMFRAGVPLTDALRMASHTEDRHLAGVSLVLADRLQAGYALSQAMRLFPGVFERVVVGLIAAAEQAGHLHETLFRLADTEERALLLRRRMVAAAIYPAILTLSTLLLTALFLFYILPLNGELFDALDVELSWSGRLLTLLFDVLGSPWSPVLVLAVVGAVAAALRSRGVRRRALSVGMELLVRVPPVGSLVRKARSLRMLQVLSLTLSGGGTVDSALRFMLETVSEPRQHQALQEVRDQVFRGGDFSLALEASGLFPSMVTSLLQVGYETGRMERMVRQGSKLCEEDVELALDTATRLLEPLLLALSGLLAGFAIISSALPLLQLLHSL